MKRTGAFLIIWLSLCSQAQGQNPSNDQNWKLNADKSDEFNSAQIDNKKWARCMSWGDCDIADDGTITKCSDANNLYEFKSGILSLYARNEKRDCKRWEKDNGWKHYVSEYTEGALFSKCKYDYGYFEIRCKMPMPRKYKGINPSFWLYGEDGGNYSWNEIDIYEFNGFRNIHTCNVHYRDYSMVPAVIPNNKTANDYKWELRDNTDYDFQVDFSTFHIFACEWTPNYVNFYFDDQLIRSTDVSYCKKLKPMTMYVTMGILDGKFGDKLNNISQNLSFPYEIQIDYIRYYNLKMDCKKVVNQSNFNFNNFNYAVKKSITLKNSSVPKNGRYTLRATDYIELQGDFEVPFGSELTIMPTPEF